MGKTKEILSLLGLTDSDHDTKTVLLVDDDLDVREILAYSIRQPGVKILEAEDGEAALEVLKNNKVDLLIADYYMPKMNGVELLRICQEEGKYLGPAIMISATINAEIKEKSSPYSLIGLLAKNQSEELQQLITEQLHQKIGTIPSLSKD